MKDRRISAYLTTSNHGREAVGLDEVLASYLTFASEVVVCDRDSHDGTWEELRQMTQQDSRIRLLRCTSLTLPHDALALAREACRCPWVFEGSPTLVVDDSDAPYFDSLLDLLDGQWRTGDGWPSIALPVLRFRGGVEHVRRDRPLSRQSVSCNDPDITHDMHGLTDRRNGQPIPCIETVPADVEALRHDGSHAKELGDALDRATGGIPVLWCHESIRDVLPPNRLPAGLLPTPLRRTRVLRPQPRPISVVH
ncbi:MAG: glycosyltransferase family 2 protein [Planctomycetes bacterium]|nr:glycosyltransferase family 2 protein [Planctomycetota bacterium]MCB9890455.1 glycosyltransferase family 2 protein [Planctomycetota bacterium]MCB9917696.1 glycosyltransferase family 2 protein [Planctomycetota bacterium]